MATQIVMVPGWRNSGPAHWQSLWERERPSTSRIAPASWDEPDLEDWLRAIDVQVIDPGATVLVAHSLGCLAAVTWLTRRCAAVQGSLLVAPPKPDGVAIITGAPTFVDTPQEPLRSRSIVVASRSDPYCPPQTAALLAQRWRATLVDVGDAGHLNADSGFGPWPEGKALLEALLNPSASRANDESD